MFTILNRFTSGLDSIGLFYVVNQGALAGLIPASKAVKIKPLTALRTNK